ncbi:MAG TPA: Asp23/Gls24 family envelope stress response protein [Syntrophomonas sp.]|jgi:uncharacterized alkaline shock family protein YloU|nr:Asp23/Gls24 family envelope stress response protein [Syntrophomonas sp.]
MHKITDTEIGIIQVSKEVIQTIAGLAAVDCYGLVGMVSQDLQTGISSILGRENVRKGVDVHYTEQGFVIDLYVMMGYGIKIKEVASSVIQKVTYVLRHTAGIPVAAVNVNVKGVKVPGNR